MKETLNSIALYLLQEDLGLPLLGALLSGRSQREEKEVLCLATRVVVYTA